MPTTRQAYLDWLRIAAIIGVLFFHSAMPFVSEWGWHIKNKETSNLFMEFNFFLSRFRMPLLFFISGTVTYYIMQKRTTVQFIKLRFKRLFIPLIAGMLLTVPIQVYMERLDEGFKGNFLDFYPTIFTTGPYPAGNLSWHHLWFILYLFIYDVVLAPLFKMLVHRKEKFAFFNWFVKGKRVYLLMLPSVICFSLLVLKFPQTNSLWNDWCWLLYWMFFLLIGFICGSFPTLLDSLEKNRRTSFQLAVITILFINYLRWNNLEPKNILTDWQNDFRTYFYLSLYAITAWSWVFTIVSYGKRYLNRKSPVLLYVNAAVYPFYILHQTVIVVIAFYVVRTNDTILSKYLFIVVVTFLISMTLYHLFISRVAFLRFLFGVKSPINEPAREVKVKQKENKPLPIPA